MTASINPDDYSHPPKDIDSREQQGFVYDDPKAPPTEPESNYVPEREFVLMPLFRRIGQLVGIRQREEPEYINETAPEARVSSEANASHQDRNFIADRQSDPITEPALAQSTEPGQEKEWAKPHPEILSEAVPIGSEPITLHEAAAHLSPETPVLLPEPEVHEVHAAHLEESSFTSEPVQAAYVEPVETSLQPVEEIAAPVQRFEQPEAEPTEFAAPQLPSHLPEVTVAPSTSQGKLQRRQPAPRRKDEIDEAIAILREAGSKVSSAISQAVQWLSEKEEELVRKAERSLAPQKVKRVNPSSARTGAAKQPLPASRPSAESKPAPSKPAAASDSSVSKWEPLEFPALQREMSWTGNLAPARPAEASPSKAQPVGNVMSVAKRGPALVPPRRRVPFWKRIDWAAEFTPKRVAVLGGVVMAMLIIAGVTFARRPASEVLPPQPRTIQPSGVTVTTHPKSPVVTAPAQSQKKTPAKRDVAPAPRRTQRAVTPDEPEVVTRVYKQKPSPTKQSTHTVAGVKHYSDMD